jgi:hypothetical protein
MLSSIASAPPITCNASPSVETTEPQSHRPFTLLYLHYTLVIYTICYIRSLGEFRWIVNSRIQEFI